MKKITLILAVCALVAAPAMATPSFDDGGVALKAALDSIGASSVDVLSEAIDPDHPWSITASGGSVNTLVIDIAGLSRGEEFGVYNGSEYVVVFDSTLAGLPQATLSILANGDVYVDGDDMSANFSGNSFGYYLKTDAGTWHSDDSLDAYDHMAAYQGNAIDTVQLTPFSAGLWEDNEYILAWEKSDMANGGGDYADLLVMVESVKVPVPGAFLLGMLGLSFAGAKMRKRA